VALLDDKPGPAPEDSPFGSLTRNALRRALYLMAAKRRCRGRTLSCFLDDLPWEMIPRHLREDGATLSSAPDLIVNSSFRFAPHGDAPPDVGRRVPLMDGLLRGVPLAWIEDTGRGLWTPFWVRGEWVEVLESLRPGEPAPGTLSPEARRTLVAAHLLERPGSEQQRRERWDEVCREAGAQFQRYGYAVVRNLIPPLHIAALRQYYRALVVGGDLTVGDNQVAERYRLHSEPVALFFHPQLASLVGRIAGERVKPSYIYFVSYPPGSELPRHVDREQCEFSISLLADYTPDPDGPCNWPLFLEHPSLPDRVVAANLGLGDAVFYRGRQLVHYRNRLSDGHRSSSIFLHYVREDFAGDTL